jgi:hypothetical protein
MQNWLLKPSADAASSRNVRGALWAICIAIRFHLALTSRELVIGTTGQLSFS